MRQVLLVLLGLVLVCGTTFGGYTACPTQSSLADLKLLAECQAGDKIFSNFDYTGFSGSDAAQLTVPMVGYIGDYAWSILGTWGPGTYTWGYTVTVDTQMCPECTIVAAQLDAQWSGIQKPIFTAIKDINGGAWILPIDQNNRPAVTTLPGLTSLTVLDTLIVDNATPSQVTGLVNTFGQVPEPVTMALFGSGLLALGLIRRFRR
jgi:hypothetical protein